MLDSRENGEKENEEKENEEILIFSLAWMWRENREKRKKKLWGPQCFSPLLESKLVEKSDFI